jgi:plasmid stabilization system protein ParE
MRSFLVPATVEAELLEALAWYRARDARFAEKLAAAMDAAFVEIAERPMMWPVTRHDPTLRARHLLAFHYTVFYRVTSEMVRIVAVTHMRRHPDSWKSRR